MKKLWIAAALAAAATVMTGGPATAATAETTDGDAVVLSQPKPAWLTPALEAKINAAGPKGVEIELGQKDEVAALEPNCLGTAAPYVGHRRRVG